MRDVRQAARRLARDWRFTAAAVLILGLGIGANTAIFSLVDATLFRRAAIADPDRLVDIYQINSNPSGVHGNTYPAYQDMAAYTDVFADAAAVLVPVPVGYLDRGALRSALVEHVTPSYPSVLGLRPSLGRWFDAAEDRPGAAARRRRRLRRVAAALRRRSRSIVGRTLPIEGVPVTIVGVGPKGHRATIDIGIVTDFWMPVWAVAALGTPRVRAGPQAARGGLLGEGAAARRRHGGAGAGRDAGPGSPSRGGVSDRGSRQGHPGHGVARRPRSIRRWTACSRPSPRSCRRSSALVLAIAGSNLATLLLVRGTARAKEVSLRLALGASRGQSIRLLLTESLLLALAGCAAGCVLAWWAVRALVAIDLPIVVDLSLDYRVLAFAAAISVVTGVAFGLAPALKATRVDLVQSLRGDGEARSPGLRRWTLKDALVAFQVALSVAAARRRQRLPADAARARGRRASASPWTAWR